ncbi:aspartate--tRNA ligase [Christensenellaceae bacterium OttesenSCG-928-M15]|nr:aspartate--tRNA ligase [Christensenellaceae bacterium OttesenSCG-928-M15]
MSELLLGWKRTHYCTEFTEQDVEREVVLMGWANARRDLGALLFITLRDRTGLIQITFDQSEIPAALFEKAQSVRAEYVLAIKGTLRRRTPDMVNERMKTGAYEVRATALKILGESETPPIEIGDDTKTNEQMRLKYRYLDLRRPSMQANLMLRHKIAHIARSYFAEQGFFEIETPILTKSTPEGARDYLVPSRVHPGAFYALPQSPQQFKQLLMLAGYDRYMQIARCFRDEDLRADRQPEFTQIDLEMSFVEEDDVMAVNEGFMVKLLKETLGVELQAPFKRLSYDEAMNRYGSDKPDTRFGLELVDISDIVKECGFKVFTGAIENGGSVRLINVQGAVDQFSRKDIDGLTEFVKTYQAKGLAWISMKKDGVQCSFSKFLTEEQMHDILTRANAKTGDILFFVADKNKTVYAALGALRLEIAKRLNLIPENTFDVLWVKDFPLLEWDEDAGRYFAMHHPFTHPKDEDIEKLKADPGSVRAKAYDIVLNGNEVGGGSIRIHSSKLQADMFEALGFTKEETMARFGFLIEAFQYGTPPHGGLAYGLDRLAMLLANASSIREVIAFPKVQNASCLMTNAPDSVDNAQLKELNIKLDVEKKS